MYTALHVMYSLFSYDFSEIWVFATVFRKILKYKIPWQSVQQEPSCSIWTDGRADGTGTTKLIVAFRNFANASKNERRPFHYSRQVSVTLQKCAHYTATNCASLCLITSSNISYWNNIQHNNIIPTVTNQCSDGKRSREVSNQNSPELWPQVLLNSSVLKLF